MRFRCGFAAVPVMLVSLLSCRPPYSAAPITNPGGLSTVDSLANFIRANPPPITDFIPGAGQTNGRVTDWFTLPWNHVNGSIHPHVSAHIDSLYSGKVLARLQVDSRYGGLQPAAWYYWVVVDTSATRIGQLASLYVPVDPDRRLPHFVGYLSMRLHPHRHQTPFARWATGSDGVGWASCSMYGCCCGDQHCEKRGGP